MKHKHPHPCPICDCDKTRTLSDESAVEIYEFLEAISANFQSRYWPRIARHYALMAKRNINEQQPWRRMDNPF